MKQVSSYLVARKNDSLQIGGITCRNFVAYVGLSDAIDTLMTGVDAILGMDIIAAFPDTQLHMDKQQLVFPAHPTPMPQDIKPKDMYLKIDFPRQPRSKTTINPRQNCNKTAANLLSNT